jgi:hypothetical protein
VGQGRRRRRGRRRGSSAASAAGLQHPHGAAAGDQLLTMHAGQEAHLQLAAADAHQPWHRQQVRQCCQRGSLPPAESGPSYTFLTTAPFLVVLFVYACGRGFMGPLISLVRGNRLGACLSIPALRCHRRSLRRPTQSARSQPTSSPASPTSPPSPRRGRVVIMSTDRDLYQLLDQPASVLNTTAEPGHASRGGTARPPRCAGRVRGQVRVQDHPRTPVLRPAERISAGEMGCGVVGRLGLEPRTRGLKVVSQPGARSARSDRSVKPRAQSCTNGTG